MMIDDGVIVARLVMAVLLGGIIGFERRYKRKTAGLRTHVLVCLGACLITILSVNMYAEVQGLTNADPTRLAAQVVSGIGFLGAGAILKEGLTIRGLTTAASLWVVASVGIAIGAGSIVGAFTTTLLVVLTLELLPRVEKIYIMNPYAVSFNIRSLDKPGQIGRIGSYLGTHGVGIAEIHVEQLEEGEIAIPVTVYLSDQDMADQLMVDLGKIEGIISVSKA